MLDAALIKECADPSLKPAIVEQFVEAAGSPDPLAITVKSGGRLILVPKVQTAGEALEVIRQNVSWAVVRVGLTQFPAGVDAAALKSDLLDPCANLRTGTTTFAKILRIVSKWYGNPGSDEVFPRIFEDAVYAWKTGEFEGLNVFQAEDPGEIVDVPQLTKAKIPIRKADAEATAKEQQRETRQKEERDGMRVDLSRIGG
ncbi:TraH family protein [Agrobacterium tumefaciens]|uniref:Conjugal transfer protein TraH n=1 Tax=Agrobacterium tumefaciens TaxID=358 RepID=A0A4D7Z7A0_AGRTU|nr:TraH family protein [Agrobacterium tumefaciens]QCL97910.1 conjugal transfer protein TraH [Agrobacterium tumefaciens]